MIRRVSWFLLHCFHLAHGFLTQTTLPNKKLSHSICYDARAEAEALLARAREMRQQIADLQGVSLQQVEDEAKLKKERNIRAEQEAEERRKQLEMPSEDRCSTDGTFLLVPETFEEQIYQAKQAVERAFRDGLTRQIIRFALLEEDQTIAQQDGQWPGGAQQMYRQAAGPMTRALMSQLRPLLRSGDEDTVSSVFYKDQNLWARKKPKVTSEDIWDFDGSALVTAEWLDESAERSGEHENLAIAGTISRAIVQPNTDDKYTRDIEQLSHTLGPNQLLMIVNPFWRNVDSWGVNLLAPNAKKNAQRVIFDGEFQETYCLIRKSARGEDCFALKVYPYDWQLYAIADSEHWPYDPYLVRLGSAKSEPTGSDFSNLLNEREEFRLSKNMRQMQRMTK